MPKIKFTIITLFENALKPYLDTSMMWKAQEKGIVEFDFVNLRDFGLGPHKSVDDTPYGGGDGMLLRCEPVFAAIESIKKTSPDAQVILPTPAGQLWTQKLAKFFSSTEPKKEAITEVATESSFEDSIKPSNKVSGIGAKPLFKGDTEPGKASFSAEKSVADRPLGRGKPEGLTDFSDTPQAKTVSTNSEKHFIILCPHYEGYDERILTIVDHKISLGPYILTGGELPALIIIDSIVRLLPGVLGGETSAVIESFSDGDNIEYPQYTKPAEFRGMKVPEVLLSGHHAKIAEWRAAHSKSS